MQKTLEQEGGAPSKNKDGTAKPSEHLMAVHYRYVDIITAVVAW